MTAIQNRATCRRGSLIFDVNRGMDDYYIDDDYDDNENDYGSILES